MITNDKKVHIGIVIDMQNDFCGKDGSLSSTDTQAVVEPMVQFLKQHSYDKLFATRDTHPADYLNTQEGKKLPIQHCIEDTPGHALVDDIKNLCFNRIINKHTFGYNLWTMVFTEEGLYKDYLAKNFIIDIMGVCTDICVVSNALFLKALYPDSEIRVLSDLCAGTTLENHQKALDIMKQCQIDVITSKEVL